jgi:hypothetical protein
MLGESGDRQTKEEGEWRKSRGEFFSLKYQVYKYRYNYSIFAKIGHTIG